MPGTERVETIHNIRKLRPNMKIIAISGSPSQKLYLSAAAKLGADAVFSKPLLEVREEHGRVIVEPAPSVPREIDIEALCATLNPDEKPELVDFGRSVGSELW